MKQQRRDESPLAPGFHVSQRGGGEFFRGPDGTTRLPLEDFVLESGQERFGLPSVASSKALVNGDFEKRSPRIEVGGAPPFREFEHLPPPSVISPRISASVNHRVPSSVRPKFLERARSLIVRKVTLNRAATLISACILGRMSTVWQTLGGLTVEKSKAARSRNISLVVTSGNSVSTRASISSVIWSCFLYPLQWRTQIQKPARMLDRNRRSPRKRYWLASGVMGWRAGYENEM
jgi:hypothetical protein